MKKVSFFSVAAVAVIMRLLVLIVGCEKAEQQSITMEPIRVGAVLPLTGNLSFLGEAIRNGIEMAKDEFNAMDSVGGRKVEVIYEDSKGTARDGVSAVQKLVDVDKQPYLIINLTNVALASGAVLERKDALALMLSTHPEVLTGHNNFFRIFISGVQESKLMADYCLKKGYKSFVIVHVDDAYGDGTAQFLRRELEKSGVVKSVDKYPIANPDFRTIITIAHSHNPDALIVVGYGREYPQLFRQFEELGWTPPIISNLSFANLAGQALTSPLVSKVAYASPAFLRPDSRLHSSKEFEVKYMRKYGKAPDFNSAYGYDNLKLLVNAILAVGNDDIIKVRDGLRGTKGYLGAIGRIDILSDGDSETDMLMVEGIRTAQ